MTISHIGTTARKDLNEQHINGIIDELIYSRVHLS